MTMPISLASMASSLGPSSISRSEIELIQRAGILGMPALFLLADVWESERGSLRQVCYVAPGFAEGRIRYERVDSTKTPGRAGG